MIIEFTDHDTTAPRKLQAFRDAQVAALKDPARTPGTGPVISDAQIRESLEGAQLKLQRERGTDLTIFSPRAAMIRSHMLVK